MRSILPCPGDGVGITASRSINSSQLEEERLDHTFIDFPPDRCGLEPMISAVLPSGQTVLVYVEYGRHQPSSSPVCDVVLRDPKNGELVASLLGSKHVNAFDVSREGSNGESSFLASASMDREISLWNLNHLDETVSQKLEGHTDIVVDVSFPFFQDCRWLCSTSHDSSLRVWDLEKMHSIASVEGSFVKVTSLVEHGKGRFVLSSSRKGPEKGVRMISLDEFRPVSRFFSKDTYPFAVMLLQDPPNHFVVGYRDSLCLYDLRKPGSEVVLAEIHSEGGGIYDMTSLGPNRYASCAGGNDASIRMWDGGLKEISVFMEPALKGWYTIHGLCCPFPAFSPSSTADGILDGERLALLEFGICSETCIITASMGTRSSSMTICKCFVAFLLE